MNIFAQGSVWQLVAQADFMTKVVLFVLLCMSILSWSIALYKYILLHIKQKQIKTFLKQVKTVTKFDDLHSTALDHAKTFPGHFVSKLLAHTKSLLTLQNRTGGWQALQSQCDQTLDDVMHHEEAYVGFLSVNAAAAPLLGLYGTVWGLIHAFIRIGQQQSADIITVAPGIAEALITTLAGLLVAIPSLALFYGISIKIKNLENNICLLTEKTLQAARILLDAHTPEPHTSFKQQGE